MNLLVLAGPTATGKSELALRLAERLNGEIISIDSMQVYRGMDVGTAKPTLEQRARVPHHLIDVVDVTENFDAEQFRRLASRALDEIRARGRLPILCGGTGLYFRALLEGLGEAPATDPRLRSKLEAAPLEQLLEELKRGDPVTYERVDRQNPRRVIRAVEVLRLTGKPYSAQRAPWGAGAPSSRDARSFGLARPQAQLLARIDRRVDAMFRNGLVAETRELLKRGLEQNRTAMQALGYRQVVEHLRGERSLEETTALVKIRTRQFAKRQRTWFRRQPGLEWIELAESEPSEATVERMVGSAALRLIP